MTRVALLGLGEVGSVLADDLAGRAELSAWDVLFADAGSKPTRTLAGRSVRAGVSAADAVTGADVIISAVTAAQTCAAAEATTPGVRHGAYYLDLNSAAPAAKVAAAAVIDRAGGRYVEAAVMAPIEPKRLATPMLLGGPHAEAFLTTAHALGFVDARVYDHQYGRAAAAKLCRSVMVKGVEALLVESLLAGRHYGVEQDVIASLSNMFPGSDWRALSRYMMSRAIEHGARRAEEMREAARTVKDAGVEPLMSAAIAARQDWTAERLRGAEGESIEALLDAMQAAMKENA